MLGRTSVTGLSSDRVVEPSDREDVSAELDLEVDLDVDGIMDRVDALDLRHTLYWSVSE